jgi:hypothetical protein
MDLAIVLNTLLENSPPTSRQFLACLVLLAPHQAADAARSLLLSEDGESFLNLIYSDEILRSGFRGCH